MIIGDSHYPCNRAEWRNWLREHHRFFTEIWVRRFRKGCGHPSICYDDLVE